MAREQIWSATSLSHERRTVYASAGNDADHSAIGRVLYPTAIASVAKIQHHPPKNLIHRFLLGLVAQSLKQSRYLSADLLDILIFIGNARRCRVSDRLDPDDVKLTLPGCQGARAMVAEERFEWLCHGTKFVKVMPCLLPTFGESKTEFGLTEDKWTSVRILVKSTHRVNILTFDV